MHSFEFLSIPRNVKCQPIPALNSGESTLIKWIYYSFNSNSLPYFCNMYLCRGQTECHFAEMVSCLLKKLKSIFTSFVEYGAHK